MVTPISAHSDSGARSAGPDRNLERAGPPERWLPVVAAALALAGMLLVTSPLERLVPPCLFRAVTHLYCPGCGSGRMIAALARMDFGTALRMNPLALLALPAMGYGLLAEGLSAWGIAELPRPRTGTRWSLVLLIVIVSFWVLRNVPAWPFALLAPG